MWTSPETFHTFMPILALYFAIVTGVEHYAIIQSIYKSPRTFVKNFLGITIGSLFLHLIVLFFWAFTHIETARMFVVTFSIGYLSYLVFETIALVIFIKQQRKKQ